MFYLKIFIFNLVILFSFSGCLGVILFTGTVVSTGMTVQEIDEDYNGSISEYIDDKTKSFYRYIKKNTE